MYPYNIENKSVGVQEKKCEAQNAYTQLHMDDFDSKVAEMILHSHKHETSNIKYYNKLAALAKHHHDKKVINDISLDCTKHCQILADICVKLSFSKFPEMTEDRPITENYEGELEICIFSLMDDVEFYRHLMFSEPKIKDKMHEIVIDKQNHIMKLIFLQSKNSRI